MKIALIALAALLVLSSGACARYVLQPEIWIGAKDFEWDGDPLDAGDTVVCDVFLQVDGTTEWLKIHDDVPWDVAAADTLEIAYDLGTHHPPETRLWFRTDVQAWIGGELFQYSSLSSMEDPEPWYVGRVTIKWHGRPR